MKLDVQIQRIIDFNKIMARKVGDLDHIFNQAIYLNEEGQKELATALYKKDRTLLRDSLADTLVVATGGVYLCEGFYDYEHEVFDSDQNDVFLSISSLINDAATSSDCGTIGDSFNYVMLNTVNYAEIEGVDVLADLKAVNDSNFSKFCRNMQEVNETIEWYMLSHRLSTRMEKTGNNEYPYAVFAAENKGDFLEGKLVKSVNYKKPVFLPESNHE